MEHTVFSWRGEPILDIHAWAKERGERMVRYEAERTRPSLVTLQMVTERY